MLKNASLVPRDLSRLVAQAALLAALSLAGPYVSAAPAATTTQATAQQTFATPDQAVDALLDADRADDVPAILRVLGPEAAKLVHSDDPEADKRHRAQFVNAYNRFHTLEQRADGSVMLVLGERKWPMPIPLTQRDGRWRFDAVAGAQEILNRRIGRHELDVQEVCRAYVTAQREYAQTHRLPDGTPEYATRIMSSPGKHDGLYWPTEAGKPESPLGPLFATAQVDGNQAPRPYHGYLYRILTGQGGSASGGAMTYIVEGHLTKGFALLAYPAQYGETGILTFVVNGNGIVRTKNLGPDTANIAAGMQLYNPDDTWRLPQ